MTEDEEELQLEKLVDELSKTKKAHKPLVFSQTYKKLIRVSSADEDSKMKILKIPMNGRIVYTNKTWWSTIQYYYYTIKTLIKPTKLNKLPETKMRKYR
jgi:hypothetical protein